MHSILHRCHRISLLHFCILSQNSLTATCRTETLIFRSATSTCAQQTVSKSASHLFLAFHTVDASYNDINYHPIKPLTPYKQYPNKEATWRRRTSRAIIASTCGSYTGNVYFYSERECSVRLIQHLASREKHLHSTGYFLGETTVPYGSSDGGAVDQMSSRGASVTTCGTSPNRVI